eukprot:scaffold288009_cov28-Tisochrysis_lutea.AAC.1
MADLLEAFRAWQQGPHDSFEHIKHPKTPYEIVYQSHRDFTSHITIGADAPNATAFRIDGSKSSLLSMINPQRMTILNFGSCTCPPFLRWLRKMDTLAAEYSPSNVDYRIVYITEAHPVDGWMGGQIGKKLLNAISGWGAPIQFDDVKHAQTLEDRLIAASKFVSGCDIDEDIVIVDGIEDEIEIKYEARPERIYVVQHGKILWRCGVGPFDYDPLALEEFLQANVPR